MMVRDRIADIRHERNCTLGRLPGFDYRRPFFYMVTLKKRPEIGAFSRIVDAEEPPADGRYLVETPVCAAFSRAIRSFAGKWRGIAPIECFAIMPDHIHLLLKIEDTPDRLALGKYVYQIEKALAREYWNVADGTATAKLAGARDGGDGRMGTPETLTGARGGSGRMEPPATLAGTQQGGNERVLHGPAPSGPVEAVFEREWHDWIVKKDGQLAAFTRYIRENGLRAWRRQRNRRYFTTLRDIVFAGRTWHAYGNAELLDMPVLEPFRCSRKWAEDGPEWREAVGRAERTGPGGAGVGTFLSPCEKACGNAIYKAGGALVVLTPDGFPPRWHPPRAKEALCAEGRMLFLSLYAPQAAKLDNATMYRRCHEMGDALGRMGDAGRMGDSGRMVAPGAKLAGALADSEGQKQ